MLEVLVVMRVAGAARLSVLVSIALGLLLVVPPTEVDAGVKSAESTQASCGGFAPAESLCEERFVVGEAGAVWLGVTLGRPLTFDGHIRVGLVTETGSIWSTCYRYDALATTNSLCSVDFLGEFVAGQTAELIGGVGGRSPVAVVGLGGWAAEAGWWAQVADDSSGDVAFSLTLSDRGAGGTVRCTHRDPAGGSGRVMLLATDGRCLLGQRPVALPSSAL